MNASPQYVLGYGSLAAERAGGRVATLRGWRRCWGVAMNNSVDLPGYKLYRRRDGSRPDVFVAFLDIEPDPAASVTGVLLAVAEDELGLLDRRERNYERVDVSAAVADAPGRVWAYRGSEAGRRRLREGRAHGSAVVSRDYLEAATGAITAIAPDELAALAPGLSGLMVLGLRRIDLP